jgi:hypothetical protein
VDLDLTLFQNGHGTTSNRATLERGRCWLKPSLGGVSVPLLQSGGALKVAPLLSQDGSFNWADLEADTAVNAGIEINPVELRPLFVATFAWLDTRDWTGIKAIRDSLADIRHDRVSH